MFRMGLLLKHGVWGANMVNQFKKATNRILLLTKWLGIGAAFTLPVTAFSLTFVLPKDGNVIGQVQYAIVQPGDTLATIALRYNMGGYEMTEANPGISYSRPKPGTRIIIPSSYVLPDAPRKGVVINLAEMRLYLYHDDGIHVSTFPAGVGQEGWDTPLGKTTITRKRPNPTWVVPDSILANHLKHGKVIPKVKPPGPDNPLGKFALNIGFKSIVIHGTPQPKAVGVRSSHGCIRMTNEDVEQVFNAVKIGTEVNIVHQPTKVGRLGNQLLLESHVPISEELYKAEPQNVKDLIHKAADNGNQSYRVEWKTVYRLKSTANGIPMPIGQIY